MLPLSESEQISFDVMKRNLIVQPVEAHRLDQAKGVIIVPCGDGDQFPDIYKHHSTVVMQSEHPRTHTLALNGGALLLPKTSPLNHGLREDLVLIYHIERARMLKGIDTVALYAHWPCGVACDAEMNFFSALQLLVQAKERLKSELRIMGEREEMRVAKVACYMHLASPEGKRRTYFISARRWKECSEANLQFRPSAPPLAAQ